MEKALINQPAIKGKRKAKYWTIIFTILYVLFFHPFLQLAFLSFLVYDDPKMTCTFGVSMIVGYFCLPFSLLITIPLMWKSYFKQKYKKIYKLTAIPLYTIVILFIYETILEMIFKLLIK